jgi:5-methylthioribose kinase
VFRVKGEQRSLIIKQGLPYARVVGAAMPLPVDRVGVEVRLLREYARLLPGSVPEVYSLDEEKWIVVMEDMSDFTVGRIALIKGTESPRFAEDVGNFIAKTVFYTSDFYLDPTLKKELISALPNPGMRQLTEDLVFVHPFAFDDSNYFEPELRNDVLFLSRDSKLRLEVAKLKHRFMTKADALIHSDLHTGSIFLNEEKTVVFDPEFGFVGPFGFDLGQFIANLYLNGIGTPAYLPKRIGNALETWYAFTDTFSRLWREESAEPYTRIDGFLTYQLKEIFADALGYAGCELIRRSIGIAQIEDINYEQDDKKRAARRRHAVELGKHLILNRETIGSLEELGDWFVKITE